jgi:WD repeat-containing protein 19
MCFLTWGVNSAVLAVGTGKGNVLIYNDTLGKKIPIMGKHTRKITCGAWNDQGRLVLGGDDKQVTISKADGDTVRQVRSYKSLSFLTSTPLEEDDPRMGGQWRKTPR